MTSAASSYFGNAVELQAELEPLRKRFLASVSRLRPKLHRYCARMCGSTLDGEDVVQEALAYAFYQLASLKDEARLEAWLFRIAHHKCVDFLRRERRQREDTMSYDDANDDALAVQDDEPSAPVDEALAAFVGRLPPKERAAVLLKDVLQYRLAEVADVVESTVGGVKAALHRGRTKLRALQATPSRADLDRRQQELLAAYVELFNRRDWDALRALVQRDARLEIVGVTEGTMLDAGKNYFTRYAALPGERRFSLALVDGEAVVVHWAREDGQWRALTAARLWWRDGTVVRIRDYVHVEYVLAQANVRPVEGASRG